MTCCLWAEARNRFVRSKACLLAEHGIEHALRGVHSMAIGRHAVAFYDVGLTGERLGLVVSREEGVRSAMVRLAEEYAGTVWPHVPETLAEPDYPIPTMLAYADAPVVWDGRARFGGVVTIGDVEAAARVHRIVALGLAMSPAA